MSRLIAGRIGFSVNGGGSGGVFNFLTQYILKKQDFWEKINITGGTVSTPGNGYKYHFFTGSGPLVVYNGGGVDYIVVAGGGGGGRGSGTFTDTSGGGGGAGGYRTGTVNLFEGQYHVIIGSGGPGFLDLLAPTDNGNGNPSSLKYVGDINTLSSNSINIESSGGGCGGRYPGSLQGRPGGSGGGGGSTPGTGGTGNTPPTSPSQGNPGGNGIAFASGGGGGSGGPGIPGSSPPAKGGNGGLGIAGFNADSGIPSSYGATGPSPGRWFAGGGGGGGTALGFGGVGPGAGPGPFAGGGPGGRPGSTSPIRDGIAGTVNTGGGGGGGAASPVGGSGGGGGSGIVIIRYRV